MTNRHANGIMLQPSQYSMQHCSTHSFKTQNVVNSWNVH